MNIFTDANRTDRQFHSDPHPNSAYNERANQYLNQHAVCHMVDAYQWYNSQVFALLATHDSAAFERFADSVSLNGKDIANIASGGNPLEIIASKARMRDATVRQHLHKTLGLWEEAETSALVDIRNSCVHHQRRDFEGRIARFIQGRKSSWGLLGQISLSDGKINFSSSAYLIAAQICMAQISIFDQMVANRFALKTSDATQFALPRSYRG